ncbi:uncharacterized protein LOC124940564 [Impatiens glandulifera]|uniref:uncharacterized protein LOC124940564 n=1 Tax=Impatiens glandulifera TaxID=253017 RepID=UPI001FB176FA|nr:uncharacterized protein LOC124940564 [Impatiens glandulifera]
MDRPKVRGPLPYELAKPWKENNEATSRGFMLSHPNCTDPSKKPQELSFQEAKPILNYSIQTGEEFALEFMDHVNPRKPSVSNTPYSHGSVQPAPHTSSDYGAFDSSSRKIKVLCSFGGRILPRPSDGKLRYVGGETHIFSIKNNINWQKLWKKVIAIYSHTHVIKYQLPGEDLDALVSISYDEDIQNMMEECHILGYGEGSKKLRMFLFSMTDLDDAHFSLGSSNADSEIQYVVAVNSLDTGSLNNMNLHGMKSTSGNKLDNEPHADYILFTMGHVPLPSQGELIMSRVKSDGSILQEFGNYFTQPSVNSFVLQAEAVDGKLKDPFPLFQELEGEFSLSSKNEETHHVPVRISSSFANFNEYQVLQSRDNSCKAYNGVLTSGCANSVSDPLDLSYLESVLPRRTFYSERIPREQSDLLIRLSKSDDSFGSQLLSGHPHSGSTTKDFSSDPVQKLQNENLLHPDQLILSQNPTSVDPHVLNDEIMQPPSLKHVFSDTVVKDPIDEGRKHRPYNEATFYKDMKKDLLVNGRTEVGSQGTISVNQLGLIKYHEDTLHGIPDKTEDNAIDNFKGGSQPSSWMESSTKDAYQGDPMSGDSKPEHGDILIDINDRFPLDFLSDIFSKSLLSDDDFPSINKLQRNGSGLSLNIKNQDPKHWSFFQKLAGAGFAQGDMSLIDQDHFGYSSGLPNVAEEVSLTNDFSQFTTDIQLSHVDSKINYGGEEDHQELNGASLENLTLVSNYNPSQDEIRSVGPPPLNPSLGEIDISTLQIINNGDLEELKELGSGTFGTVYHGKWRGTDVAIKRIKKSCFTARLSEQERLTVEFWREADILSKLHHPNVVAFYGVVQNGPGGTLATVTEYMVDGSLRHVLLHKDRHLDRRRRLIIAMDAAFGMEYLHSKNIVHFDLKCDNLLVDLIDPSRPICKVGDFGLSKIKRNTLVSGGVRGTLPWMAPELLNGSSNKVSEKVDVFSFGIVLWEILTVEEPYANMHYGAIIGGIVNNTLRPSIPSYCDLEWRELMEQCWAPSPPARPSFTEIASRLRVMSKEQLHKACQPT